MKVVVTGGTGRLGRHVCKELHETGHEVIAVDAVPQLGTLYNFVVANLLDREQCREFLEGAEAVVHLANHRNDSLGALRTYMENTAMNFHVFQTGFELGIRKWIYASSIQALGGFPDKNVAHAAPLPSLPLDGTEPANPENAYALSKAAGEQMLSYFAERFGLEAVAIRFPRLYFPEDLSNAARFAFNSEHDCFLLSYREAARLVAACLKAFLPGFRVYLPTEMENGLGLTLQECFQRYLSRYPLKRPLEETASLVDLSRITEETGWTPLR